MSESKPRRESIPGFVEFRDARQPSGSGTWTIRISRQLAEKVSVDGAAWRYYALLDVPALLFQPECIFEGPESEGTEGLLWYVGRPRLRRRRDGTMERTPIDRALFVFVSKG